MDTGATIKKYKRKRGLWSESNENVFIEMWEEKIGEIRGKRKNSHIYKEMAAELAKNGIEISPDEVKAKITNLTTKFRKCKSYIGPSGGSPSEWPLYDKINRIIGSQPINNMQAIVEDSIIDILQDSQSGDVVMDEITNEDTISETSMSLQAQSLTTSSQDMSPTLSSSDKPSSSRGAKNKKILEMFEKFGNSFEKAMAEDKKCTEELMALEKEKLKIFKDMRDSTDRLTSGILDFLKNSDKQKP